MAEGPFKQVIGALKEDEPGVTTLNLSLYTLDDRNMAKLGRALSENKSVVIVDILYHGEITEKGIGDFMDAVSENESIRNIAFDKYRFTDKLCDRVLDFVNRNKWIYRKRARSGY